MNLPTIGLVVALAIAGIQTVRLSNEQSAHDKTVAKHERERADLQEAARAAEHKAREVEDRLSQANLENANEQARLKADAARRIADAQRAAAGLRDTIYALGRRERPENPAAAGWFDAAAVARGLVGECSERRTAVAEAAADLRAQVIGLQRYVSEICQATQ